MNILSSYQSKTNILDTSLLNASKPSALLLRELAPAELPINTPPDPLVRPAPLHLAPGAQRGAVPGAPPPPAASLPPQPPLLPRCVTN